MLDSSNPLVNATNGAYDNVSSDVDTKSTNLKLSDGHIINVSVPKDCSEQYFRRVVAAAFTAYNVTRNIPDVKAIAQYMGHSVKLGKVSKVVATPEYKAAMLQRGINVSKSKGLLPEQSYALEIMSDPARSGTFNTKLRAAGISYTKWRSWLKDPVFRQAFDIITESMLNEHQGDVHTALVGKAISGDMRAIEYYNQITGRFDPNRIQVINQHAIIQGLIEIIIRHVTDENVLMAISNDIDRLQGKELPRLPAAIEIEDAIEVEENSDSFAFDFEMG